MGDNDREIFDRLRSSIGQKAARKDTKNLAKLRKDLEKYRDKAPTEGFAELCNALLEMLPEGE